MLHQNFTACLLKKHMQYELFYSYQLCFLRGEASGSSGEYSQIKSILLPESNLEEEKNLKLKSYREGEEWKGKIKITR